ncbi:F-box/LRR-repeat protein 2 [Cyphellophora attinorum]|uniref:F-box/LRR-repeat protein 2 n=1 Tax=Cyphellophora attinorum TaxID=1664694 RepID=A0A0N1HGJ0_9EURO|nr:F-box/LRR-repeat protein 2 [Phialophora attinorum]KPI44733.1 F-box/LRR-repeat protein 2 [Phialophora attinorum]
MDSTLAVRPVHTPRPATPVSPEIDAADGPPAKLKGRHKLIQSLQRMSSSPSLAKLGRTRSTEKVYRPNHKASISCTSLNSANTSSSFSPPNSFSSQLSYGYSTAPTTPGSPGSQQSYFDTNARLRPLDSNELSSVSVPIDIRSSKPISTTLHEIPEKPMPRRQDFNFWRDLPHEIRVQIFGYLTPREVIRMSAVSKHWHDMCFDGQLWTSLDCQSYYTQITSEALIKIMLKAGGFVKDLNLRGCVQLRDQWLSLGTRMTNQECRNLENLVIEGCKIERASIHFFLLRNPKLLHINMRGMQNINNSTMRIISSHCTQLEVLNIDWCSQVDSRGLRLVVQSCPNLRDLRASDVRGFDDLAFMKELFERNNLERLLLQHCDTLTDEALEMLVHGEDPERDVLSDRPLVPPRRLRHLDLKRCRNITDRGLKALVHNVPFLEGLRLCQDTALTDDSLVALLPTTPRLTHLEVEEVENLTNATLIALAGSQCARTLEHLNISYCEQMGDSGTLPLLKACTNVRSLCLDNTRVSDLTLMEAAELIRRRGSTTKKYQRPKKGLELVAFDCANVTWAGVREILQSNCRVMSGRKKSVVTMVAAETGEAGETENDGAEVEEIKRIIEISTLLYPSQIIHLKAFYGWQQTVEEHYKRCSTARWGAAARLEHKWAEWMVASQEVGSIGGGWSSRRRRRRAREAEDRVRDENEHGVDMNADPGTDRMMTRVPVSTRRMVEGSMDAEEREAADAVLCEETPCRLIPTG